MKTHIMGENYISLCGLDITNGEATYDLNHDNLCENCKRTDAYKQAKAEQKRKDVEELKGNKFIKEATSYVEVEPNEPMKPMKPKTYKQKIEIEIDVPVGMELFDYACLGKSNDTCDALKIDVYTRKKVKTGAELVGVLCGFSDKSLEQAEINATEFNHVGIVESYNFSTHRTYNIHGNYWLYAYPVPAAKLAELKANLEK